jgi:hypothetical protein
VPDKRGQAAAPIEFHKGCDNGFTLCTSLGEFHCLSQF